MPELPGRPDVDQLRRQARELQRAAADREPSAVARLSAVSQQVTLSAAQLAVAREYGFPSWPALRAEAERRRRSAEPSDGFEDRWSFGGADRIETSAGLLQPAGLMAGPQYAALDISLVVSDELRNRSSAPSLAPWNRASHAALNATVQAVIDEVTFIDGRGTAGTLRTDGPGSDRTVHTLGRSPLAGDEDRWLVTMIPRLDPVPSRECGWVELRGRDGSKTRLTRSARAAVRPGHVVPVPGSPAERELSDQALEVVRSLFTGDDEDVEGACSRALARAAELRRSGELPAASEIARELAQLCGALAGQRPLAGVPRRWSAMIGARGQADGAPLHRDISADLPPVGNIAVRVDSLVSEPRSWHLYLRAKVSGWNNSEDRSPLWSAMPVQAEDDRGGTYLTESGNAGTRGYDELALRFLPRLDPLARAVTLTFTAGGEQVALEIRL
jgi:hypothetical protein